MSRGEDGERGNELFLVRRTMYVSLSPISFCRSRQKDNFVIAAGSSFACQIFLSFTASPVGGAASLVPGGSRTSLLLAYQQAYSHPQGKAYQDGLVLLNRCQEVRTDGSAQH
jgi:hypothetical protein